MFAPPGSRLECEKKKESRVECLGFVASGKVWVGGWTWQLDPGQFPLPATGEGPAVEG